MPRSEGGGRESRTTLGSRPALIVITVTWTPVPNACGVCGRQSLVYTTDHELVDNAPPVDGPRRSIVGLMRCESCGHQGWVHTAVFA